MENSRKLSNTEFKVNVPLGPDNLPHLSVNHKAVLQNNLNVFMQKLEKELNVVVRSKAIEGVPVTDLIPDAVAHALNEMQAAEKSGAGFIIDKTLLSRAGERK